MAEIEGAIQGLAERLKKHSSTIVTEEAAKTSIVLPFLQALGFDIFNPGEVIPEFTADTPGKKGEKVDYAVVIDGAVKLLIECKSLDTDLEQKHLSQLYRYFSVTSAKFALLTNGRVFQFYTSLEEPNKLDKRPFFTFDLLDYSTNSVVELSKFEKGSFDETDILANAERLKYVAAIKTYLIMQLENPSPELVKVIASDIHDGRVTAQVRETISQATRVAFKELIRDSVRSRLSSALESSSKHEAEIE